MADIIERSVSRDGKFNNPVVKTQTKIEASKTNKIEYLVYFFLGTLKHS